MTVNTIAQSMGDTVFPVSTSATQTEFTALDPGRRVLAELFRAAINDEFGAAWRAIAPAVHAEPALGDLPVNDVFELEPSEKNLQQRKFAFPCLCVHRTGEATFDQVTLFDDRLTQSWAIHYIMGPIDLAGERKLSDICGAIAKLIRLVIRQRGHRSYESGALQFFRGKGGFASIELKSQQGPGQARFAGDDNGTQTVGTTFYAMTLTLETTEDSYDDIDAYGALQGISVDAGVGNATEILPSVIQAETETPLQIG